MKTVNSLKGSKGKGQKSKKTDLPVKQQTLEEQSFRWTQEEILQYCIGSLQYLIDHPLTTISWTGWKPVGFYPYLQAHMIKIFFDKARNQKQCKSKDENFKITNFVKSKKKIDIKEFCFGQIWKEFMDYRKIAKLNRKICDQRRERNERIQKIIKECQRRNKCKFFWKFEEQHQKLFEFSESPQNQAFLNKVSKQTQHFFLCQQKISEQEKKDVTKEDEVAS